jgi:uncharacterized protein (DUF58 family)
LAEQTTDYNRYLDPKTLTKIGKLDLIARLVVEGYISGLHKSPYHGFSVEFADHREYVPGDDIKHVDWRQFAKTDRYYIKQYEEETNLRATLLLDTSESMRYGSGEVTKHEYACFIAASLAYMLIQQQDSAGLALFDSAVHRFIPPKTNPAHLKLLLHELNASRAEKKTSMDRIFHDVAERIHRRGLVVVISDLFDDPETILMGLRHFRHNKHEIIVFHVLDEAELSFPFDDTTLFDGLEEYGEVLTEPRSLRDSYLEQVADFTTTMKRGCRQHEIDYVRVSTATPLDVALSAYLASRSKRGK